MTLDVSAVLSDPSQEGAPVPVGSDRDRWLAERLNYVTASDVAAVLGLSPFKTAKDVLEDKLGLKPFEDIGMRPRVAAGRHLEAGVFAWACEERGWNGVLNGAKLVVSPTLPCLAATPDGYLTDAGDVSLPPEWPIRYLACVEVKNVDKDSKPYWKPQPGPSAWEAAMGPSTFPLPVEQVRAGKTAARGWAAPLHYWVQLQVQMHCTGLRDGWLVACIGGNDRIDLRYEFNTAFEAWMLRAVEAFWAQVVAGRALDLDTP